MTTGQRLFFEALRRKNTGSRDYEDFLKILGEYYPDRVLLGLTGKKYYDPAEVREDAEAGGYTDAREQEDREYRLRDPEAPRPVKLVLDNLEYIRDRIQSDYEDGLMDEFEYTDYNIAGDGYSY